MRAACAAAFCVDEFEIKAFFMCTASGTLLEI
jgi:hypothetical protein